MRMGMKYFLNEDQRRATNSTNYLEFLKGHYCDRCWLSDSINIPGDLWDELNMSELILQVNSQFDCYGLTIITKEQWLEIVRLAKESGGDWENVTAEAATWVDGCFKEHEVFTIMGL